MLRSAAYCHKLFERRSLNNLKFCFTDPEIVLDTADPNSEANLDEDYEGYEGFYDDENEGSFASNDSASASHNESSQGRLTRFACIEIL